MQAFGQASPTERGLIGRKTMKMLALGDLRRGIDVGIVVMTIYNIVGDEHVHATGLKFSSETLSIETIPRMTKDAQIADRADLAIVPGSEIDD